MPQKGGNSVRLPRFLHHFYAWFFGYFWHVCPLCGNCFGGHEKCGIIRIGVLGKVVCLKCARELQEHKQTDEYEVMIYD